VILAGALCLAPVFTPACAPPDEPRNVSQETADVAPANVPQDGPALADDDLVIVDLDAGPAREDGERAGKIFLARAADGYATAVELTRDETWPEPVDAIVLPDRSLLVLDSRDAPADGDQRGAIYHCAPPSWKPVRWWSDERARQPVSMVRAPDGTVYVADREADPLGLAEAAAATAAPGAEPVQTGCVFAVRVEPAPDAVGPGRVLASEVLSANQALVTPAALLLRDDGALWLLDADANPHNVVRPDGLPGSPGLLFEVRDGGPGSKAKPRARVTPRDTVSPIALIRGRAGEVYVVDANGSLDEDTLGDGVVWRVEGLELQRVFDTSSAGTPRAMVDPVHGDVLPDGRLVIADANADPLGLGADGTGKGVYGTGRGALLAIDLNMPMLTTLLADERFVSPVAVRRVRP
jgi:hypothetical protein